MKYLSSKDVASILGINISTLKRWTDTENKLCKNSWWPPQVYHAACPRIF